MSQFMSLVNRHAFPDPWLLAAASLAAAVTIACLVGLAACQLAARRPAPLRAGILLATLAVALLAPAATAVSSLAGWGLMTVAAPATSPDVKLTSPTGAPAAETDATGAAIETEPVSHAAATATEPSLRQDGGTWLPSWRMLGSAACWVWLVGSAAAGGLLVLDLVKLARFRQNLEPCAIAEASTALGAAARSVGLRQRPRLCESAAAAVPLVAGPLAPVVVLPRGLARRLSAERLAAVLVHESAHIANGDLWVAMLQRLAAVAFWWCPPLHRLNRRLADVREDICDNHVVRAQGHGVALAEALVELAANLPAGRRLAPCTIGTLAERPGVVGRVERLARCDRRDAAVRMSLPARWGTCCVAALALGVVAATTLRAAAPAAVLEPEEIKAIDAALEWIAARQQDDGGWEAAPPMNRVAATSLAILPFLGRGHTHFAGPQHDKAVVQKGLDFLVGRILRGKGSVLGENKATMYTQGLATMTLCKAYALTTDPKLREPAQQALDFIAAAQDPKGGGWRYQPQQPGDTSAVGWQVAALVAGQAAGLDVDPDVLTGVSMFLDGVDDGNGMYGYTGPGKGRSTTASGLLSRIRTGWEPHDERLAPGIDFVIGQGPGNDLYFDYFATQLLHEVGGEREADWRRGMRNLLLAAQVGDGDDRGSWFEGVDGLHGRMLGRFGCTALAAMILEIPVAPRVPRLL